ncbi:MAG TPA: AgmX/PglI C-terminal domain-containing protein [Sandaracinaceae bacterium LLY-WYZ-13_1]|nr:AgmX/PglI C-terminal domain-containing protein [Sandaracinaceae bacterium LLY-WYZ-13_1]
MTQGSAKVPITFQIYKGEELVGTETLSQDIIKVGKLPSSHLRIEDDNVSRMHAVIEVTSPDEIFIIDLGSAAGTIVNGKKVNKTQLQNGDEIVLGDTRVTVEIGEAAAAEQVPPAAVGGEAESSAPDETVPAASAAPSQPAPQPTAPNPFAAGAAGAATGGGGGALPNPFAASSAPAQSPAAGTGEGGAVRYGIQASGPPVNPSEVESAQSAAEVVVMWGDMSVLHVEHLSPPRSFYVGEGDVDYLVEGSVLGAGRMPVVVAAGGGVAVVVPEGAEGEVTVGDQTLSWADLKAQGKLQPCAEMSGAMQYPLPDGATAKVRYKGFTFMTKQTAAGKRVGGGMEIEWKRYIWTAVSLAVHGAFLLMFYFLPPRPASLSLDLLSADSRLVEYLMEPPETQEEETPEWLEEQQNMDDNEGGTGKRHRDEEGAMGEESSEKTNNRFGIEGPEDNTNPQMAREQAREQARNVGAIGVLRAMTGSWNSPTSPYGADQAMGNDPMSAIGALMGDQIGSNFGFGGLGLRGTGRGGGGTGEGTIGLGNLGTIGHGAGGGSGSGYGRGAGGLRGRSARVPRIRTGNADVRGSLSREVIRRVIRRHINEVRFCYEQELNARPDLEGRVLVSFIISATGAVQSATVGNSTINNARVEGCITQAVRRWTFPAPDGGGVVGVNYPFVLSSQG